MHQLLDKLRDYGCIGTIWILPASEDIEESETVSIQTIMHRILLTPFLITVLRKRIVGEQFSIPALALRQIGLITVDQRDGGIDIILHPTLPGNLHLFQSAHYILGTVKERHLDATRDAAPGRLVQGKVHPVAGGEART